MTDVYCIEGCGRPAVTDRPIGVTSDGHLVTELVCWEHASPAEQELWRQAKKETEK